MFTKSDIRRVTLAITRSRYRDFIVRLGEKEILHITGESAAPGGEYLPRDKIVLQEQIRRAERIITAFDDFLDEHNGISEYNSDDSGLLQDLSMLFVRDYTADEKFLAGMAKKNSRYFSLKSLLQQQMLSLSLNLDKINKLIEHGFDLYEIRKMKLLSFIYGRSGSRKWKDIAAPSWFYIMHGDYVLILLPESERTGAMNILRDSGFEDMSDVSPELPLHDAKAVLMKRINELKRRVEKIDRCYESLLDSWIKKAVEIKRVYSLILQFLGVEKDINFSDELIIAEGWVDMKDAGRLQSLLDDLCGSGYFLSIASKNETRRFRESVPVLLKNSRLFRPFELLVKMMGLPGNAEVDPTPAAAVAYVITFGVMFGDAGQGIVLAIAGLLLRLYAVKNKMQKAGDFGSIIIICGLSATLFGFLYGSVFSNEHLIPALLFHPMEHMMELFLMAIMMGVVFISTGIIFNIINRLFSGDYEEAVFGIKGILGLTVYISAIYIVMRYILKGVVPSSYQISVIGIPVIVMFFLRGPLSYLLFHYEKMFHHGLFEYTVETIIEIMEMFSGFLGNTISFIRAGAFALSHAGLSIAVFTLAEIVDPGISGAGAISVIVIGNIFIILLEGLVCGIQSMRLEFYEFFGKFFSGDGVPFRPFSLKSEV